MTCLKGAVYSQITGLRQATFIQAAWTHTKKCARTLCFCSICSVRRSQDASVQWQWKPPRSCMTAHFKQSEYLPVTWAYVHQNLPLSKNSSSSVNCWHGDIWQLIEKLHAAQPQKKKSVNSARVWSHSSTLHHSNTRHWFISFITDSLRMSLSNGAKLEAWERGREQVLWLRCGFLRLATLSFSGAPKVSRSVPLNSLSSRLFSYSVSLKC